MAEEQASLFVNLDTSFSALASIARPFLQETISEAPLSRGGRHPRLPAPAPLHPQQHGLLQGAAPGRGRAAAARRRCWRTPSRRAPRSCPRRSRPTRTSPTCSRRSPTSRTTRSCASGVDQLTRLSSLAQADAQLPHAGPDRLQLRDALVPQRREPALGGRPNGNWQRFQIISAPTERGLTLRPATTRAGPRARRRTGPARSTTCTPTRTRTRPRPGQTRSARPATSATRGPDDHRQPARQPGHQDQRPDGHQRRASGVTP